MEDPIRQYLAIIGERGGRKSRRKLSIHQAQSMVKVREARKAFRIYYAQCFWFCRPDLKITLSEVRWVGEQLMKHGGREAWMKGAKLCR